MNYFNPLSIETEERRRRGIFVECQHLISTMRRNRFALTCGLACSAGSQGPLLVFEDKEELLLKGKVVREVNKYNLRQRRDRLHKVT